MCNGLRKGWFRADHRTGRILLNCQEAAPALASRLPITHLDFESLCELI
jgi:hypothetical protein